jgi:HK97 family phage portal protein
VSLFAKLLGGPVERKVADATSLTYEAIFGTPASKAGVSVGLDSSLRVAAVFAACRVLADGMMQVPLKLMQKQERGSREADDHPLFPLLAYQPNEWQTAAEFIETMMWHAVLSQGGTALLNYADNQRLLELIPLIPGQYAIRQRAKSLNVVCELYDRVGAQEPFAVLARWQFLHVRGPSWNSVNALELVRQARESIGLSIAIEESQGRLYANGARPSGLLTTEASIKPETVDRVKAQFVEGGGLAKSGGLAILDRGWKYQSFAMTGTDAQTLESRKFQIEEVGRMFRVFPQMLMQSDKTSTYASAEQFFNAHVVHSLGSWFRRWEQALRRDLLTAQAKRDGYYFHFVTQGLMRGDAAARSAYYTAGITNGWMTRNEARALEDMNPIAGLDLPLAPLNMADGTKPPKPQPAAKPATPARPMPEDEAPEDDPAS